MADAEKYVVSQRAMPPRSRSTFLARTATDDAAQLDRGFSVPSSSPAQVDPSQSPWAASKPYQPQTGALEPSPRLQARSRKTLNSLTEEQTSPLLRKRSSSGRGKVTSGYGSLSRPQSAQGGTQDQESKVMVARPGALPRPVGGYSKLGTFSGVFVPTSLNVLSILMFLRFGFILGQSGFLGMMGMLIVSYLINLVTTFSLSAIATNGTVRGGGAYYLISRSLGPEFGGSIGVVFYLGSLLNTSMNAVGLVDCLKQNFGDLSGNWVQWLPEGFWWEYLWASMILILCTGICLAGSSVFARCSNGLLALLLLATFSIPFSTLMVQPFRNSKLNIDYTGLSGQTFRGNLEPHFTRHAAGSQINSKENFRDLLGILFPATGGIFAGASMSGDLKHPSKAIPKGTLGGLALTFAAYTVVIMAMAASITRDTFYHNVNIIQDVNLSGVLILLGEFATSFFSALMGVIGSAKLLQALARDNLLPGISCFGQGTKTNDEPTHAILITYAIAQISMLSSINQLASFVTMTYLMTFLVTNLACFLLKISAAPNFRPSFHYFNWWTAAFGTMISAATMFFVDGGYATGCVGILVVVFLIIHYFSPPKSWGDVSQSLIYHQVRKYLLRLRQEHVKFWRPQILLFINDPRHQFKLIQFCNALKKGALFVLGHVVVADDFGAAVPEARQQQAAWSKYIDFSKIKAFVNIAISPGIEWGTRNIVLSAGLGGMRPNIVVMGFYNLERACSMHPRVGAALSTLPTPEEGHSIFRQPSKTIKARRDSTVLKLSGVLPTDSCRTEGDISPSSYVTILEDLLLRLRINVAVAKGFQDLEFPHSKGKNTKKYIDLWPIQMSAEFATETGGEKQNVLTTNFDTYTLILQLGCILDTVPAWKKLYRLRVAVFVEYESDVEEERRRVKTLLTNLRIEAEVLVFWLASGDVKTYQIIVNGDITAPGKAVEGEIDELLKDEEWWQDIQKLRGRRGKLTPTEELKNVQGLLNVAPTWPSSSFQSGRQDSKMKRFEGLKRYLRKAKRRASSSDLGNFGVRLGMRTHRLHDDLVHRHGSLASASEGSESDEEDETSVFSGENGEDASSHGRSSAASVNEINDLRFDDEDNVSSTKRPHNDYRRRSDGDSSVNPLRRKSIAGEVNPTDSAPKLVLPQIGKSTSSQPPLERITGSTISTLHSPAQPEHINNPPPRPHPYRLPSTSRFSSTPMPPTRIASEDGLGPSIMFSDSPPIAHARPYPSIYNRHSSETNAAPSSTTQQSFPAPASLPLSFNDLPCRAQHLILNELLRAQSADTAVLFTTLPSPVEGTGRSEEESLRYLRDLEMLCEGLPPVLLVHSNSMTVTMSL
ncbi:hypothetical protein MMC17_008369 [Xylographa soralifera]|nr:hypothetical protein [Xylographa soralifera]